jgi:5-methylcytosine-specific restriction endonuclease McrA
MARKIRDDVESWHVEPEPVLCPMCERVIPDDQQDAHHLVPKSKGGKKTVCLHRVCHNQIHAIFTDSQLAKTFFTIEAILEDPAAQKFVEWVKNKPPGFSDSAKESRQTSGSGRGRKH